MAEQLRSIQYLRGVAALAIVAKHAFHPPFDYVLSYGVDLFFVISGFIMVASTRGRSITPALFLVRRAWRILPMWWLSLALVFALGLGRGSPSEWLSSAFLIPYGIENTLGTVSWGVGWTLCFEAAFYALFAIGLAAGRNFVPLAIIALVPIGLFWRSSVPLLSNLTHPLLLEFLMGHAIAKLYFNGWRPPHWLPLAAICLFAIGSISDAGPMLRVITAGLPLGFFLAGLVGMEERLPRIAALQMAGDASYSIYLLHYVPIMLLAGMPSLALMLAGVSFGFAAYWFIERRVLSLRVHANYFSRQARASRVNVNRSV